MHSGANVSQSIERGAHPRLRAFVGASTQDSLTYWRNQYRQLAETLENGVPFHSIARPALEEDLGAAAAMVAQYEAQATEEQRKPS